MEHLVVVVLLLLVLSLSLELYGKTAEDKLTRRYHQWEARSIELQTRDRIRRTSRQTRRDIRRTLKKRGK